MSLPFPCQSRCHLCLCLHPIPLGLPAVFKAFHQSSGPHRRVDSVGCVRSPATSPLHRWANLVRVFCVVADERSSVRMTLRREDGQVKSMGSHQVAFAGVIRRERILESAQALANCEPMTSDLIEKIRAGEVKVTKIIAGMIR